MTNDTHNKLIYQVGMRSMSGLRDSPLPYPLMAPIMTPFTKNF